MNTNANNLLRLMSNERSNTIGTTWPLRRCTYTKPSKRAPKFGSVNCYDYFFARSRRGHHHHCCAVGGFYSTAAEYFAYSHCRCFGAITSDVRPSRGGHWRIDPVPGANYYEDRSRSASARETRGALAIRTRAQCPSAASCSLR